MSTLKTLSASTLVLVFVSLLVQGFGQSVNAIEEQRSVRRGTKGACGGDIDIRNYVQQFDKLVNCTVIEGYLHILLIDSAKPEDYMPYTFPDLVEITDHLLLYRVFGLKSLRTIFPNLAVIRGHNLFLDYALIAYEMPHMTDLGLRSLTSIPRGAVRLEKNTNLCFIETVDWGKIATNVPYDDNYFKGNKDIKECVNRCPDKCDSTMSDTGPRKRCWTISDCQRMLNCPDVCETGFCNGQTCCDSNCVGGCSGPSAYECTACKDVIQYDSGTPICASRCSPGTYKFKNRRCLLDTECLNFTDYQSIHDYRKHKLVLAPSSTESGECVLDCPAGYKDSTIEPTQCQKCEKCAKACYGKVVDSVSSAQELKQCTIITGPLDINIRGGDRVMQELEENLAQIEEVTGHIRIYDTYSLMSLHFFKNLKVIGGEELHKDRYSLVVYQNLNLQELFLENVTRTLKFGNGTVSFQANRRLCYKKIMSFVNATGLMNKTTDEDVAIDTNGDQEPCDVEKLDLKVIKTAAHMALFRWSVFNITDKRHLISYTLNYKETEEKNVSIYKGRDACSDSDWKGSEFKAEEDQEDFILNYIYGLKPWTQYATYVSTLTISKANKGAVSDVIYFRTAAEVSTSPTDLQVKALVPGELHITWKPPDKPNGNISHYEVYWQKRDLDPKEYELRDYCTDPLTAGLTDKQDEEENENNSTMNGKCCTCPKSEKELKIEARERNMEIKFQDFLQNEVYLKRHVEEEGQYREAGYPELERPASTIKPSMNLTKAKLKRAIDTAGTSTGATEHELNKYTYKPKSSSNPLVLPTVTPEKTTTEASNDTSSNGSTTMSIEDINEQRKKENPYFKAYVYNVLELDILNLGHHEDYNIEVIACQERDPREPDKHTMLCSHRALGLGRTLPNGTADSINSSTIVTQLVQNKTGTIFIKWDDPPKPNGLILTYDLKYKKSNVPNVKPLLICITYTMYVAKNRGHVLDKLDSGNYTFKLRATSLAGNGSWTEEITFMIPEIPTSEWSNQTVIVVVVVVVIVVFVIAGLTIWFIAKKRFNKKPDGLWSPNPDYIAYEPDEWEVDRDNVQLIKELGQGSFGMVYEGMVKNLISGDNKFRVAVKTTNSNSNDFDRYQFLQEASIMKAFKCHHVVKLMGVVSRGQPAYVLMELMPNGDLKNFLRMHRPDESDNDGRSPPTLRQILQMAGEIADGMAYLADKKYVHRDLAARNCMVAENMTVKIGDFGMTRDIYETDYYRKGSRGLLPVRWMAPESLKDGVFTSMSDVWSCGVVLWEMATLAAQPYQGLSNEEVLRYATSGKIMDMPERCPSKLYDLMVKCWRYKPKQRPTFKEIIEILLPELDKKFKELSYFFSEENAKYEEGQRAAENNQHNDMLDNVDDDEDDSHCPMNDYVDEANLPMLGVGASNGHSVELEDIFTDNGTYPHYSGSHKHVGSSEFCDCPSFREVDEGAAAQSVDFTRQSVCSSPTSAIGGSSDGSKDSSKSSSSSYAHMNGLSVANGHVPMHVRTAPCYQ